MTYPPSHDPWPDASTPHLVDPLPPRRRRRVGTLIVIGAALVVVAAGVGIAVAVRPGPPTPSPSSTCDVIGVNGCTTKGANGGGNVVYSPPAGQAIPAAVKQACDLNEHMRAGNADLRGQGTTIGQIQSLVGNSQVFDVKFAANMLKDRYDLAAAAKGGPNDVSTTLDLTTASLDLSTACVRAGWSKS